jgi:hypothetical protein
VIIKGRFPKSRTAFEKLAQPLLGAQALLIDELIACRAEQAPDLALGAAVGATASLREEVAAGRAREPAEAIGAAILPLLVPLVGPAEACRQSAEVRQTSL